MKNFLFLLLFLLTSQLHAAIIYVNASATGSNNGTSWANAYTNLETTLLFAMSGDEIWVAKGTYYTSSTNDRNSSFLLNNGVKIYGNFYGNETNINQRIGLIPNASGSNRTNETILSGDIGLLNDSTDNANHVMYIIGNTLPVIIDGVKITGGNAILTTGKGKGGGIYIQNTGNVILNYVIVSKNTCTAGTEGKGGGIYVESAAVFTMQNSTVVRNTLIDDPVVTSASNYFGGGIYINCPQNQIANSFIENNKVISNRSNIDGGGLYIDSCLNLNISNTSIKTNLINSTTGSSSKYLRGGGLTCNGIASSVANISASEISNNSITIARGYTYGAGSYFLMDTLKVSGSFINNNQTNNNSSTSSLSNQGGGMYSSIARMTSISNSTFDHNKIYSRYASGGGLYLISTSADTATLQDCRFSGNEIKSLNYFDGIVSGGGFYSGLKVKLINCDINNNSAVISSTEAAATDAYINAYGGGFFASNYAELLNCNVDTNLLQSSAVYNLDIMNNPDIICRAFGGGIYSTAKLALLNSGINNNMASADIQAIYQWTSYFFGYCYGGGVYNEFTTSGQKSMISNCSVNNNKAETYISLANGRTKGGGIYGRNIDFLNNDISNNKTYIDLATSNNGGGLIRVAEYIMREQVNYIIILFLIILQTPISAI